jgi:hypothetical protein
MQASTLEVQNDPLATTGTVCRPVLAAKLQSNKNLATEFRPVNDYILISHFASALGRIVGWHNNRFAKRAVQRPG